RTPIEVRPGADAGARGSTMEEADGTGRAGACGACPGRADAYAASDDARENACAVRPAGRKRYARAGDARRARGDARGPGARENARARGVRSEEHTSELQSRGHLVCRLLLEKKKKKTSLRCHCTYLVDCSSS